MTSGVLADVLAYDLPTGFSIANIIAVATTLLLVLVQLRIMRRQTDMMEGQSRIMEQQNQIFANERQRRAVLALEAHVTASGPLTDMIEFRAVNRGNRVARDFYWHISVPATSGAEPLRSRDGSLVPSKRAEIGDVPHDTYQSYQAAPLYMTRGMTLGRCQIARTGNPRTFTVTWQMTGEDGMYPDEGGPGLLTVTR